MVTDLEGTHVDYRQPWSKVGKSDFRSQEALKPTVTDSITHNKFEVLSEMRVNETGLKSEVENGSSGVSTDVPVPQARADFCRKPRMPELPPHKSHLMRMGCESHVVMQISCRMVNSNP